MSASIYLLTLGLPLLTILLVFGMKSYASVQQARAKTLTEDAYRAVAEKAVSSQTDTSAALGTMQADLADIKTRLAAIEKVLKTVE